MAQNPLEILAGAAVIAVATGFVIYAGQLTGASNRGNSSYPLTASFRSAEGISVGTDVRLAGVKVGSVTGMQLNSTTFRADTVFSIDDTVILPDDSAVIVSSEGLLGGSFIELLPGGSPFNLDPGAEIEDTQSAVSLINLLLKYIGGGGGG